MAEFFKENRVVVTKNEDRVPVWRADNILRIDEVWSLTRRTTIRKLTIPTSLELPKKPAPRRGRSNLSEITTERGGVNGRAFLWSDYDSQHTSGLKLRRKKQPLLKERALLLTSFIFGLYKNTAEQYYRPEYGQENSQIEGEFFEEITGQSDGKKRFSEVGHYLRDKFPSSPVYDCHRRRIYHTISSLSSLDLHSDSTDDGPDDGGDDDSADFARPRRHRVRLDSRVERIRILKRRSGRVE